MKRVLAILLLLPLPLFAASPNPVPTFSTLGRTLVRQTTQAGMQSVIGSGGGGGSATNAASTNTFHVLDFGAKGDNVTVDDLAFSNCFNAAKISGGIMDWSGMGKTYVLSNFVFWASSVALPGVANAPMNLNLYGYGSALRHVGTDWLMRWTNSTPDLHGVVIVGNANSPGGILNIGTRANVRYEDVSISGYTTNYGFLGEGTTFWTMDNVYAFSCRVGLGFGSFADGMNLYVRANSCTAIGVEMNATNAAFTCVTGGGPGYSPTPVGGVWQIVGNNCGDQAVLIGDNVTVMLNDEGPTYSHLLIGHNAVRHPWSTEANGSGNMRILMRSGFLANTTNWPVEVNCAAGKLDIQGTIYNVTSPPGFLKARVAAGDNAFYQVRAANSGNAFPSVVEFSNGGKLFGQTSGGALITRNYNLPWQSIATATYLSAAYNQPAFAVGSTYEFNAPETHIGWWGTKEQTNFVAGLRLYYAGGGLLDITNTVLHQWLSAYFHNTLSVSNTLNVGPGTGSPTSPGRLLVNDDTVAKVTLMTGTNQMEVGSLEASSFPFIGTRNGAPWYLMTWFTNRWLVHGVTGDLQPVRSNSVSIGTATEPVKKIFAQDGDISGTQTVGTLWATNIVGPPVIAWPGPTNNLSLSYPFTKSTYTLTSDANVTNILGVTAGFPAASVFVLTNSASSNCTVRFPATFISYGSAITNNAFVIPSAKKGLIAVDYGTGTNWAAALQP